MAILECEKCGKQYSEWAPACPHCAIPASEPAAAAEPAEKPETGPSWTQGVRREANKIVHVFSIFLLALSILLNVYLASRVGRLDTVVQRMEAQEEILINMIEPEDK